jgi:hypothetical protein
MQQQLRKAGENFWNFYKNNSFAQDATETALWAGGAAAGQALFTDMEGGQIATATAIGAAAAMGARPFGRRGGAALGKMIDNRMPGLLDDVKRYIPVTNEGKAVALGLMRREKMAPSMINAADEMLTAKRNQVAFNPDGTERGDAATMLSYYLGNKADNIVQGGIGLLAPALMGIEEEEIQ